MQVAGPRASALSAFYMVGGPGPAGAASGAMEPEILSRRLKYRGWPAGNPGWPPRCLGAARFVRLPESSYLTSAETAPKLLSGTARRWLPMLRSIICQVAGLMVTAR